MKSEQSFPATPASVKRARTFLASVLAGEPDDVVEAATLMVSELATNAVRHTGKPFSVVLDRTGRSLRVEVKDGGGGTPTLRHARPTEPSGRGLRIVDELSSDWGYTEQRHGTTVWFTMRLGQAARSS